MGAQLLRFLIVGLVNTGVGYSLYAVAIFLGLAIPAAVAVAMILGVLFNYVTTGTFVFQSDRSARELAMFVSVYLVIYALQTVSITWLDGNTALDAYTAGLIGTGIGAAISFVAFKFIVFRPSRV